MKSEFAKRKRGMTPLFQEINLHSKEKIMKTLMMFLTAGAMLVAGCAGEKKMEPVAVGEMIQYKDPGIGFVISYPSGWVQNAQVGQALFYNAQGVEQKFRVPTDAGPKGVEISVRVTKTSDPAGAANGIKTEWSQSGVQLGQEQAVTVSGATATKVPFTANYGEGNIINSHHVLITGDSVLYDLGFSGFGNHYEAHAAVFDAMLSSFQMPKPKEKGRDETLPSETYSDYDAKAFAFKYPENFASTNPSKGQNEIVIELQGYRRDCSVRFDVFGAQGLTLDKVFEQNKGKYRATSSGKATIGGENAMYVSYSPTREVDSRAYFVVRNDKVYRITTNWYKPQTSAYVAAYETVISSIKFK